MDLLMTCLFAGAGTSRATGSTTGLDFSHDFFRSRFFAFSRAASLISAHDLGADGFGRGLCLRQCHRLAESARGHVEAHTGGGDLGQRGAIWVSSTAIACDLMALFSIKLRMGSLIGWPVDNLELISREIALLCYITVLTVAMPTTGR